MARDIRYFVNTAAEAARDSALWLNSFRKGVDRAMMIGFLTSNKTVAEQAASEAEDIAGDLATITARAWASVAHTYAAMAEVNYWRAITMKERVVDPLDHACRRIKTCLETIGLARVDLNAPAAAAALNAVEEQATVLVRIVEGEIEGLRAILNDR